MRFFKNNSGTKCLQNLSPISQKYFCPEMSHLRSCSTSHSGGPSHAKGRIGMLVGIEEGFGACDSHTQWIARVESMKKLLGKQLKDFALGVLGNMAQAAVAIIWQKRCLQKLRCNGMDS
jgi:hypothetical protein